MADVFGTQVADVFGTPVADVFGTPVADVFGTPVADVFGTPVADVFGTQVADVFGTLYVTVLLSNWLMSRAYGEAFWAAMSTWKGEREPICIGLFKEQSSSSRDLWCLS